MQAGRQAQCRGRQEARLSRASPSRGSEVGRPVGGARGCGSGPTCGRSSGLARRSVECRPRDHPQQRRCRTLLPSLPRPGACLIRLGCVVRFGLARRTPNRAAGWPGLASSTSLMFAGGQDSEVHSSLQARTQASKHGIRFQQPTNEQLLGCWGSLQRNRRGQ